jgi:hypothetical protein
MNPWKDALPVDYLNRVSRIGKVYVGVSSPEPPLRLKEEEPDDKGVRSIVIELEDIMSIAADDVAELLDLPKNGPPPPPPPPPPILRLAIHLSGARKLCHNLISALADSGDQVAGLMRKKMLESMDELKAIDTNTEEEDTT